MRLELRAELGEAPTPGGADAPDRHAQRNRHRGVVGTVDERHEPQQRAATFVEPTDRAPQVPVAFVPQHNLFGFVCGGGSPGRPCGPGILAAHVSVSLCPTQRLRGAPCRASCRHEQPLEHSARILDPVSMGDETHPHSLDDILRISRPHALGPCGVPEQRSDIGDELTESAGVSVAQRPQRLGTSLSEVTSAPVPRPWSILHDGAHQPPPGSSAPDTVKETAGGVLIHRRSTRARDPHHSLPDAAAYEHSATNRRYAAGRHPHGDAGLRSRMSDEAQASLESSRSFVVRDGSSGMPGPFVVASVAFVM